MRGTHTAKGDGPFSRKALIALILPLIAEQFLAVLVGMADTAMVSGVDATGSAVAAVSTVDTLNVLFINLFSAMSAERSISGLLSLRGSAGAVAIRSSSSSPRSNSRASYSFP